VHYEDNITIFFLSDKELKNNGSTYFRIFECNMFFDAYLFAGNSVLIKV